MKISKNPAGGLRVDFAAQRSDGSCVRLHPGKQHDAHLVEGSLVGWRMGRLPVHTPDRDAVKAVRFAQQPPPPSGPPPLETTPPPLTSSVLCRVSSSSGACAYGPDIGPRDGAELVSNPEYKEPIEVDPDDSASHLDVKCPQTNGSRSKFGKAKNSFDPADYNSSQSFHYIRLREGDDVEMTSEDGPWAYGFVKNKGWFPRDFVQWSSSDGYGWQALCPLSEASFNDDQLEQLPNNQQDGASQMSRMSAQSCSAQVNALGFQELVLDHAVFCLRRPSRYTNLLQSNLCSPLSLQWVRMLNQQEENALR